MRSSTRGYDLLWKPSVSTQTAVGVAWYASRGRSDVSETLEFEVDPSQQLQLLTAVRDTRGGKATLVTAEGYGDGVRCGRAEADGSTLGMENEPASQRTAGTVAAMESCPERNGTVSEWKTEVCLLGDKVWPTANAETS